MIYEDSDAPMPEFLQEEKWRRLHINWIAGGTRKGQAFAVTRLIQEAKHDYCMWLEDDWEFQKGQRGFMRESKEILDNNPNIIQVSLRGNTGWHPLIKQNDLWIAEPYWRGVWGGWSWNCGLRRTAQLKELILPRITKFIGAGGLTHEEAISKEILDMGYRIADLNRPIVVHTGGGQSRAIEKLPPLPKILIAIPTCFAFEYDSHALTNAQRFHTNGPNEQTEAVRETWAADFKQFPSVDVKFFYGKPADGYPRQPLADEIFLDCPDGYDSLIAKTYGVCKFAADNNYAFVFKADTDTLVYAERLVFEIMENQVDYSGFMHANVASGGPGYILSNYAAKLIRDLGRSPQHPYAEDCHVANVLAKSNVHGLMLRNHHSGMSQHFFFGDPPNFDPSRITPTLVTAHAVFADQMRAWHQWKKEHSNGTK